MGIIYSDNFSSVETLYHRMLIPLHEKLNFHFSIENVVVEYKYVRKIRSREAVEVTIEDKTFFTL